MIFSSDSSTRKCLSGFYLQLEKKLLQCEIDGEIEYEFPIYNNVETINGLWDPQDPRYSTSGSQYGGIRLHTPPGTFHLFKSVFPYVQVELRRATLANYSNNDSDADLYQWYMGSKLCNADLESLITLDENKNVSQFIEIKIRGPNNSAQFCFNFLEQVEQTVCQALFKICPGLLIEKHFLSSTDLKNHSEICCCYQPDTLMTAMLEAESTLDIALYNCVTNIQETIVQIILFSKYTVSLFCVHFLFTTFSYIIFQEMSLDEKRLILCSLLIYHFFLDYHPRNISRRLILCFNFNLPLFSTLSS